MRHYHAALSGCEFEKHPIILPKDFWDILSAHYIK
jgi:hypothetical protein